ncbi:type II toxin-antitoxin system HicA family toxin [bacterium]|nr:type II toxin-antitoxin system HicA family toxin [bacterium]
MTKAKDLYDKAKRTPNNFAFTDLNKLTEAVGFILRKNAGGKKKKKGGSHQYFYRHPLTRGVMNFQPGKPKSKAKPYQIKQLLDHIDDHNLLEGSNDV